MSSKTQTSIDSGWAWMVLAGCFLSRMLCDGVLGSFGMFIVAWAEQFPGSQTKLSWIAGLMVGLAHITGPFGSALCKKFSIRQVVLTGTILASISLAAASQASTLWHLYVTFALAGLGFGLTFQPSYVVLTYYFDKILARANGIAFAGVGVGIFAFPPLFQVTIDYYGWQGALLIVAAIIGNLGICAAVYKPSKLEIDNRTRTQQAIAHETTSIQQAKQSEQAEPLQNGPNYQKHSDSDEPSKNCCSILEVFDFMLLSNFNFVLLLIAQFLHGIAYNILLLNLSERAVSAGISKINTAYLLSAIGISSFLSRLTHGYIIDYKIMSATVLTAFAYTICGVSSALNPIWDNFAVLISLSEPVGLTSGVFNSTVPIVAKEYVGANKVSAGTGWMLLVIGISIVVGQYVTGVLADATGSYDIPFFLAGACFMLCSLLIFAFPGIKFLKRHMSGSKDDHNDQPVCV